MNTFYQSPEFLNVVARCTAALIAILFIVGLHPFKRKPAKSVVPAAAWTAGTYYMYLRTLIKTCTTQDELIKLKGLVKGYYYRQYVEPISDRARLNYYTRLHEAITEREALLNENALKPELCEN